MPLYRTRFDPAHGWLEVEVVEDRDPTQPLPGFDDISDGDFISDDAVTPFPDSTPTDEGPHWRDW